MLKQFLKIAAMTASMAIFYSNQGFAQWSVNGNDVYRPSGNIGLGTSVPSTTVDITPSGTYQVGLRLRAQGDGVTPANYATINIADAYSLGYSAYPSCGSGRLHINNSSNSNGIHISSGDIQFGTGGFSGCGSASIPGKFKFDDQIGAMKLLVSPSWGPGPTSYTDIPAGFIFGVNGSSYFRTSIGIGTSCIPAGYALAVKGKVIAEEVNVRLASSTGCWPDYVFDKSYKLRSLNEVEKFINTNSHLPEVPSEHEIETNGINTAAMDAALLKKIEELTLYVIELNKKVNVLEKQNQELQNK